MADWLAPLRRLIGRAPAEADDGEPTATRLETETAPEHIYAIGDVHGAYDLFVDLEGQIVADAAARGGDAWIVVLGDFVDRGPGSAQVIDRLLAQRSIPLRRWVLRGNHEAMFLDFLNRPTKALAWLGMGGRETLLSYGVSAGLLDDPRTDLKRIHAAALASIPDDHIAFLRRTPLLLSTPRAIFVHAGLDPARSLAAQTDRDLLWFRDKFAADYSVFGRPVVHGHTPLEQPYLSPWRLDIDTGACFSGRLTAARLSQDGTIGLLSTGLAAQSDTLTGGDGA